MRKALLAATVLFSAFAFAAGPGCSDDDDSNGGGDAGAKLDSAAGGSGGSAAGADGSAAGAGGSGGAKDAGAAGSGGAAVVTYAVDVKPIFAAKCSPCHTTGKQGLHNLGAEYTDAMTNSYSCSGKTKGACTIDRIKNGSMPSGKMCSGNPTTDSAKPECLTAAEQAKIQAWIDGGLKP